MKRFFCLLPIMILFPLLVSCERSPQTLAEDAVILAFGDGITFGTGAGEGESYPAVLEELTGRKVVNAGVPGETSMAGLARLGGVLAEVRPQLVILCYGGEDMSQGVEAEVLIANLKTIIKLIGEANAEVFLIAVPPPATHLQPAAFYNQIARDMGVSIEVYTLSSILSREETRSEGLHPNARGYAILARELAERLTTSQR